MHTVPAQLQVTRGERRRAHLRESLGIGVCVCVMRWLQRATFRPEDVWRPSGGGGGDRAMWGSPLQTPSVRVEEGSPEAQRTGRLQRSAGETKPVCGYVQPFWSVSLLLCIATTHGRIVAPASSGAVRRRTNEQHHRSDTNAELEEAPFPMRSLCRAEDSVWMPSKTMTEGGKVADFKCFHS